MEFNGIRIREEEVQRFNSEQFYENHKTVIKIVNQIVQIDKCL